jgi:hypothetical protein
VTAFSKILSALTKSAPRTAADLRADLLKVDLPGLNAKVTAIEGERRSLLLTGSDADLERNTQALAAARLEVERGQAAIEALTRLIGEADSREAQAAEAEQAAEVQRAIDRLAEIYGRIDTATADLQRVFDEAKPLAELVEGWNRAGHQIGRTRVMFTPLDTIRQRTIGGIRI